VDIVQPELLRVGGVMPLVKVAAVAEAFGAFVAPHNAQSPYTTVVNTMVDATLPNLLIQECFDDFLVPWSHDVLSGWVKLDDGYIVVPDAPGFGVELNESEAAKYPYADRNFLRLFDAGWERRRGDER
jgi:galactonate dehydratase